MKPPLPPDLIEKIKGIESRKPENQQLQVLADIATMLQELINLADDEKEAKESDVEQFGAVLLDIRESLKAIKDREDPESQDYATPVVEAVSKLEKSFAEQIKKIEVKPVVNVPKQDIKVAAPIVNVDAPRIDLSDITKALKTEMPKAFKEAIGLIPKTEVNIPEAPDRWDEVLDWLKSIDTASRMKPQFPNIISSRITDGTDTADVVQLGTAITTTDKGLVTNSVIHGQTTAGGGSYVDVKVNPSGALSTDASGSSIDIKNGKTIQFAKIDTASSGDTQIVAAAGVGLKIKLLSCALVCGGPVNFKWRSGTTDLSGAISCTQYSGYVLPASAPGQGHYLETAANTALNINLSGAVQVSGHISYYTEA